MRIHEAALPRRSFLALAGGAIVSGLAWKLAGRSGDAAGMTPRVAGADTVRIVEFTDAGKRVRLVELPKVVKTESEWRKQLSPASFQITRQEGTERPFTGSLLEEHSKGVFRCICCSTALFDSGTKFESGTGWPSFYQPIAAENVVEDRDTTFGMVRTAVSCRRCDAHLGHVFDDGPKPTGLRYCMNSVALTFSRA